MPIEFKEGDTVRYVRDINPATRVYLTFGSLYTLVEVNDDPDRRFSGVQLRDDKGEYVWYDPRRFEKAEPRVVEVEVLY